MSNVSSHAGVKETEVPIKPDAYPLTRLSHLSDKVRRRMFARAMQEIQHAQKRSTETLEKLNFTVNLVSVAMTIWLTKLVLRQNFCNASNVLDRVEFQLCHDSKMID